MEQIKEMDLKGNTAVSLLDGHKNRKDKYEYHISKILSNLLYTKKTWINLQ